MTKDEVVGGRRFSPPPRSVVVRSARPAPTPTQVRVQEVRNVEGPHVVGGQAGNLRRVEVASGIHGRTANTGMSPPPIPNVGPSPRGYLVVSDYGVVWTRTPAGPPALAYRDPKTGRYYVKWPKRWGILNISEMEFEAKTRERIKYEEAERFDEWVRRNRKFLEAAGVPIEELQKLTVEEKLALMREIQHYWETHENEKRYTGSSTFSDYYPIAKAIYDWFYFNRPEALNKWDRDVLERGPGGGYSISDYRLKRSVE